MTRYYVLITGAGHRTVHLLTSDNLNDAREEQLGFAEASDNGIATLTTDPEIAKKWEQSCVDEIHKQKPRLP
jgi:hypothetical protein